MTKLKEITREINRSQNIPLSNKRTLKDVAALHDATISINEAFVNANLGTNQLISGGAVWVSGLIFLVSDCVFVVDGVLYTSTADTVTLSAADATHPRIDVLAVNIDGSVEVVEGTAAASPVKPEVNPDTQVEVTFVTVAALATTPTDVSNTDIYLEDTEWTSAVSANVDAADTSDPRTSSKAIKFTAPASRNYITLTSSSAQDANTGTLGLWIKPLTWPNSKNSFRIALYNTITRVSDWYYITKNSINTASAEYQFVQIPLSSFNATTTTFLAIRIEAILKGSVGSTVLIDDIKLQAGLDTTDLAAINAILASLGTAAYEDVGYFAQLAISNVFTAAQGSAITTLTDGATIAWDAGASNVFQVVLDGNRTMAAPTNIVPGYTYILFVVQDDTTGSRTITWNAVFKWAGGTAPTLSTAVDSVDVITFVADASSNLHGSLGIADSQ